MKLPELEQWFDSIELPTEPIRLDVGVIFDCKKFVESHIAMLKANPGNKTFLPYYERLIKLREILIKQNETKTLHQRSI